MKHNEFKTILKSEIKNECQLVDLQCVFIDISNNNRMIYIYDFDYKCYGTIGIWLNNDYASLSFSKNTEKPVNIVNKDCEIQVNYCKFEKCIEFIHDIFEQFDD